MSEAITTWHQILIRIEKGNTNTINIATKHTIKAVKANAGRIEFLNGTPGTRLSSQVL
jgi:hypothetical protein